MDYMTKRASAYRELAQSGVTCQELRHKVGTENVWTLQCRHRQGMDRQEAKSLVTAYLQREFEATGITFWIARPGVYGEFFVRFETWAL